MSYKKPQIVAKSAAKLSYAAGCPVKTEACSASGCTDQNRRCMLGRLK